MGRTPGAVNRDHDERRSELLAAVLHRLMQRDGATLSLRTLAAEVGVSRPTLLHYFSDRSGVLQAVLGHVRLEGQPYMQGVALADLGPVEIALHRVLREFIVGWRQGVGAIHRLGLISGLLEEDVGSSYINDVLEPILQSYEVRLQRHIDSGELSGHLDPRQGALMLVTPVLMAMMHQHDLPGARCRPLDVDAFVEVHLAAFLRAWKVQ